MIHHATETREYGIGCVVKVIFLPVQLVESNISNSAFPINSLRPST